MSYQGMSYANVALEVVRVTESTYKSKEELAGFVAELRQRAELTQEELAEALGIRQSTISRIESGSRGLSLQELGSYADYFGISVEEILRKEEEGAVLMRAEDSDSEEARAAVKLFREVIDDYFGAEAMVW